MPSQYNVLLRDREWLALGDQDLLADEIEAGHELRDRVLDLDPRVHLHEVVLALAREQALDRPRRSISGCAGRVHGDLADPRAQGIVDRGRGRLLDQLLVPPLDRAVTLPEEENGPVAVGEDLCLDVPRLLEVALDVDRVVREVLQPLTLRRLEGLHGAGRVGDDLHPLPAAACRRLDDQRIPDLLRRARQRPPPCGSARSRRE